MTNWLIPATWLAVTLLVAALVVYLLAVLIALRRAGEHLARVRARLLEVQAHTEPLEGRLGTINAALAQLAEGLNGVDAQLAGIVRLFRL